MIIQQFSPRPSPLPPSLREGGYERNLGFASASRSQIPNFALFSPPLGAGPGVGEYQNIFIML